jgi:hypothetical protein
MNKDFVIFTAGSVKIESGYSATSKEGNLFSTFPHVDDLVFIVHFNAITDKIILRPKTATAAINCKIYQ